MTEQEFSHYSEAGQAEIGRRASLYPELVAALRRCQEAMWPPYSPSAKGVRDDL